MKLCMFQTVPLSIISSLFTVHTAMTYVIQTAFEQDQDGTARRLSVTITVLNLFFSNTFIFIPLLPEGRAGEEWEPYN